MPNYRFVMGQSEKDENYAEYDHNNDLQVYYMESIGSLLEGSDLMWIDDIMRHFMIQLFIHEDFHNIIENVGIDSIGIAQHETIYQWIRHDFKW